nr:aspartyl protease family protein [Dyella sp. ASV24]
MTKKSLVGAMPLAMAVLTAACSPAPRDPLVGDSTAVKQPILTTRLRPYAQPLVPVTIDGKPYHFILDTGAPYTFIDNHSAETLTQALTDDQVPEYFRNYIERLGTLGAGIEPGQVKYWQPKPLLIGGQPIEGSVPWVGMDLSLLDLSYGSHVDGLMGANAFRQLNWGMDNLTHTLTVWSRPPSTAGYTNCSVYQDAFGAGPDLAIQLANGNGGPMRIDTGATYESISQGTLAVLREQGATVEKIGQSTRLAANGTYETATYLVDGLHFDGKPVGRTRVYESSDSNNLGMAFLSRFDNYVFIPSEMLFCYNAKAFTRHDAKPVRWVELSSEGGHLRIGTANTVPDSLPKGLTSGDILLAVNDQPADPRDIESIRRELTNTPAGELTLQIERQGKTMTVKL